MKLVLKHEKKNNKKRIFHLTQILFNDTDTYKL